MISPHDSPQVKVAKGAAVVLAGLVFARIVNYAYQSLLSRTGGQGEFGLFFMGITTLTVAAGIAVLGIDLGVARFAPLHLGENNEGKLRGVLRLSLMFSLVNGLVAGALLALLAGPLANILFAKEQMTGIILICAVAAPFAVVNRVLIKAVVAFQKIGYRVGINQVASPLVRLVLTAALLAAGMKAGGAMWAYAASEIVSCLALLWLLQFKVYPVFGGGPFGEKFDFGPLLRYCLPLFLSGLVVQVMYSIDAFMVGHYLDVDQWGLYGAAARLAALIAVGSELLDPLYLSIITGAHAQGRGELVTGTFNSNNRWLMYISLPIICMLALFAREGMTLVWGADFAAGALVLALLAAGRAVYYLSSTSSLLLAMYGRSQLILALNLITTAANIALNWLMIPRYGILGAAIATSLSLAAASLITITAARSIHTGGKLQVFFPRMLAAAALSCLPAWVVGLAGLPALPKVIVAGLVFCAVFLLLLKVFGVYNEEDLKIWRQIKGRIGLAGQE